MRGSGEVLCHKRHTKNVPVGREARGLQKIETRGEDVVRKAVHVNDGGRDPPSPAVRREVWAKIPENLMALVDEEGCRIWRC